MMDSKNDKNTVAVVVAGSSADPARRPSPSSEEEAGGERLHQACNACLRRAVLVILFAFVFVQTALSARSDPWDLAFVVSAYTNLAALYLVLRRAERLTPASPPLERRLLLSAAWALSTTLSCAFAYRTARIMPAAMAVAIWAMTATVVAGGFYFLVLNDGSAASGDCQLDECEPSFHKIPADEMV